MVSKTKDAFQNPQSEIREVTMGNSKKITESMVQQGITNGCQVLVKVNNLETAVGKALELGSHYRIEQIAKTNPFGDVFTKDKDGTITGILFYGDFAHTSTKNMESILNFTPGIKIDIKTEHDNLTGCSFVSSTARGRFDSEITFEKGGKLYNVYLSDCDVIAPSKVMLR